MSGVSLRTVGTWLLVTKVSSTKFLSAPESMRMSKGLSLKRPWRMRRVEVESVSEVVGVCVAVAWRWRGSRWLAESAVVES
jgi:hypothetical protein